MAASSSAGPGAEVDRRMALAREWDALVEKVRKLKNFEDFLRPPPLERLTPAAEAGPIIILNVSQWRCDAIVVSTGGTEVKPLPGLTAATVSAQVRDYLRALQEVETGAAEVHAALERIQGASSPLEAIAAYTTAKQSLQAADASCEDTLRDLTGWMWDEIAAPVLQVLGVTGSPVQGQPLPRLWLCPTGLLSLLPLHAAGHHDSARAADQDSLMDRAVTSYTPTLRALMEARDRKDVRSSAAGPPSAAGRVGAEASRYRRMLVVALARTPGEMPLPNVSRELGLVSRLFKDSTTVLADSAATWQAVQTELPRHSWAHFSCHGYQDLMNPTEGGLMLHDRLLSIEEISRGQYYGEFAFLSACKTATGGITLPDEAITLASALHYTGYRHVIGTMWSVHDETAADVAEAVYAELAGNGSFQPNRAATALHAATRGLRDSGRPLSQWTPFTHTGP
jgi:hypothetical protein